MTPEDESNRKPGTSKGRRQIGIEIPPHFLVLRLVTDTLKVAGSKPAEFILWVEPSGSTVSKIPQGKHRGGKTQK